VTAIAIAAWGAVSALGEGPPAVRAGEAGAPARTAIARDEELARAGLARPFAARVPAVESARDDDAFVLLERALAGCMADLDVRRPAWRSERVGLVLGTSSGAMRAAVALFASPERAGARESEAATYYGPVARAVRRLGVAVDPCVVVLGACASSALAIGLGARWLERDEAGARCDIVLAGGFDAVTVFVAAGFEVLRATTASPPPRPFQNGRDGMALGDGAAVLALARDGARSPGSYVLGFGASSDAVHLTAPDREGAGLARAARRALDEAGDPVLALVSAHATATPFNDAAEFKAMERALGPEAARRVPVHAFKASIGHTLGAGGALELLSILDAIDRGVLPASAGREDADAADANAANETETPARLLARSTPAPVTTALKLSSAFGGANAALVVGAPETAGVRASARGAGPRTVRARGPAWLQGGVHIERVPPLESLASRTRLPLERVGRGDDLVLLALAAVAELEAQCGPLEGAGVIVGTALATLETNALFAARLRERGPLAAEPRRFPYTSPNAVAGECSIAFGLTGPCFSVGGGLYAGLEGLACAAVLVESGDAPRMIAVAVDQAGPMTRTLSGDSITSGAVAFLLTSPAAVSRAAPRARIGAVTLRRGLAVADPAERASAPPALARQLPAADRAGHRALVALAESVDDPRVPDALVCHASPDAWARIEFEPFDRVRPF
jgi:3-oxoacyl-[acyl-carrier-protein] synthase II